MTVDRDRSLDATTAASHGGMSHRSIRRLLAEPSGSRRDANGTVRRLQIGGQSAQLDNGIEGALRDADLQLLRLLAQGLALDAVARHTNCSERTVSRHIRRLSDRIGVSTPIEAVVWAVRRGLI
jgi:DNA-binding NarL/FixJ family response regulator